MDQVSPNAEGLRMRFNALLFDRAPGRNFGTTSMRPFAGMSSLPAYRTLRLWQIIEGDNYV